MLGGVGVVQVEPGTVIEHNGEEITVTDEIAVFKGCVVYVTIKQFDLLRSHPYVKPD